MEGVRDVRQVPLAGKRVLLRADFNVPLVNGEVADDSRLKAALPTLEFIHSQAPASIVVLTHLGRPEGKMVETLEVAPVARRLKELAPFPEITVRENLRFNPGEEANDPAFARALASLGDLYVDDAFADAHRAHASIVGLPKLLPSFAGLLFEREVEKLLEARTPTHPALAVIGGAKFETKIPLLRSLAERYDEVLLGGALGNDLLLARGSPVGDSLLSPGGVPTVIAENRHIAPPLDAAAITEGTNAGRTTLINDLRAREKIVDIGTLTIEAWAEKVHRARFIVWNGPLGIYEDGYTEGTDAMAKAIVENDVHAVIGGGDTKAALAKFSFDSNRVFVSTGGGAMLQFLAEGTLPGIEALKG